MEARLLAVLRCAREPNERADSDVDSPTKRPRGSTRPEGPFHVHARSFRTRRRDDECIEKKNNNFVDLRLEKATTSMTSPFRGPQSLSPVLLRQSLKCTFCRLRTCAVGRDPERNFRRQTDPSGWKTNLRKPSRCQGSRLKGTDRCFAAKRRFFRVRLCATGESDRR